MWAHPGVSSRVPPPVPSAYMKQPPSAVYPLPLTPNDVLSMSRPYGGHMSDGRPYIWIQRCPLGVASRITLTPPFVIDGNPVKIEMAVPSAQLPLTSPSLPLPTLSSSSTPMSSTSTLSIRDAKMTSFQLSLPTCASYRIYQAYYDYHRPSPFLTHPSIDIANKQWTAITKLSGTKSRPVRESSLSMSYYVPSFSILTSSSLVCGTSGSTMASL
jgi:hypothetical protein